MIDYRCAAAFLVAAMAVPALAQVKKSDVPGVQNFTQIDATIACGGAPNAGGVENLKKQGFVSIINLRLDTEPGVKDEEAAVKTVGIKYVHIPFNGAMPDPKVADQFLAAVSDKSNQPAYIHCGSGGRAAAMWMIKRALKDGWPTDRAVQEAEAISTINPPLKAFATDYIAAHR